MPVITRTCKPLQETALDNCLYYIFYPSPLVITALVVAPLRQTLARSSLTGRSEVGMPRHLVVQRSSG